MEEIQTKGKTWLSSQEPRLALNTGSLQFPLNRGTKERRISLGTIQAGEEQMVSAPISGSCSGQLIVSHLLSRQPAFSSSASAPTGRFGFSSSSFPRRPLGSIPFPQPVPLGLENFLQFLHLLQQSAPPRPPAPQQAEP